MKIKVLWVSARVFDDSEETQSGVWQKSLAIRLAENKNIKICNISYLRGISEPKELYLSKIQQWGLPFYAKNHKGYPPKKTRKQFEGIVKKFNPDIIQVWGSENPFKLLPFDVKLPGIKVLTMQGVLSSMAPNCLPWFSFKEILSMFGLRELIKGENVFSVARSFFKEGLLENEMIRKSKYLITQSDWTDAQVRAINPTAKLFRTQRVLRDPFLFSEKWEKFINNEPILFTSAFGYTLKALHVLIRALPIVYEQYPNFQLRIAGRIGRADFLGDGYLRFMLSFIKRHGIENNVVWLGGLTASELVKELQQATVYINPSNVESYSNTLAEAMSVGTPTIVTFAGAMPELAEKNKEALFFTPGDHKRCAHLIIKLLSDHDLALKISQNAIKRSEQRELKTDVVNNQIEIYNEIIRLSSSD